MTQYLGPAPYGYAHPTTPPQQPQPVYPGPAVAYSYSPRMHPSRSTATAALWCSILGLVLLPFVGSILGIVLGRSARRTGYPGARATAGSVLGWTGLIMDVVAVTYGALGLPT